jgi:hypothetical protein
MKELLEQKKGLEKSKRDIERALYDIEIAGIKQLTKKQAFDCLRVNWARVKAYEDHI